MQFAARCRAPMLGVFALTLLVLAACTTDDPPVAPATELTATAEPAWRVSALEDLQGYRYTVDVSLKPEGLATSADIPTGLLEPGGALTLNLEGEFRSPTSEHTRTRCSLGPLALALESIRIEERVWTREGEGAWRESTLDPGAPHPLLGDLDYQPSSIFRVDESYSLDDLTERLLTLEHQMETVNGEAARRYSMTPEQFREVFQSDEDVLPAEAGADATFTFDVWFSEALGVPVRMMIIGSGGDGMELLRLDMNLTDLDDASINIAPPA
ncbi:MAG: hypothetical protein O2798_07205 [Chloroflexi bacterium]|nr:hypothetical protein [Chloroflexota bacterium]MDA1240615.1 hypothetical protein [Chloroflexota bacterium]